MHARHPLLIALLCLVPAAPVAAYIDIADEPSEDARPMSRCMLRGAHVSGLVRVDLRNGGHAQLELVDVEALVAMAPALEDIVYYVTAPLTFTGELVDNGMGSPAAFAPRAFRSEDGGVRLSQDVPFEVTFPHAGDHVTAHVPVAYGGGTLEVRVPCSALAAGAPRAPMRVPRAPSLTRARVLAFAPGTRVLSAPGREGVDIARIDSGGDARDVFVLGTMRPAGDAFVRVQLAEGPLRVEGFVPKASVEVVTQRLLPQAVSPDGYAYGHAPVGGVTRVRLPTGTPIFGDATNARSWATTSAPLDAIFRRAPGARGTILLSDAVVATHECRFDGVLGRTPCSPSEPLPRIGLPEGIAFVTQP